MVHTFMNKTVTLPVVQLDLIIHPQIPPFSALSVKKVVRLVQTSNSAQHARQVTFM